MTCVHVVLIAVALHACGYSEQEMQLARDRQHRLEATLDQALDQCGTRQPDPREEANDAGSE